MYVCICVCVHVCVYNVCTCMSQTANPKRWVAYDGKVTAMTTPYSLRASQLRDLYHSLTFPKLSSDERLDVLLTLKCTIKVIVREGREVYRGME